MIGSDPTRIGRGQVDCQVVVRLTAPDSVQDCGRVNYRGETLYRYEDRATLIMPTELDPPMDVIRGWIRGALGDVPVVARLHATLVADELVTNARRHGRAPYVLRLAVRGGGRTLLVSVDDCAAELGESWSLRTGLVLVGGLSRRWGVERRRRAKTVWAEVLLDGPVLDLAAPEQPLPSPGSARRTQR